MTLQMVHVFHILGHHEKIVAAWKEIGQFVADKLGKGKK
jgi:hypothetical protein